MSGCLLSGPQSEVGPQSATALFTLSVPSIRPQRPHGTREPHLQFPPSQAFCTADHDCSVIFAGGFPDIIVGIQSILQQDIHGDMFDG